MNGKRTRKTGASPRSHAKRAARNKAVKKTTDRGIFKGLVNDRALQKVRRRKAK